MKRIISLVTALCTIICMTGLLGTGSAAADVSDYIRGEYTDETVGEWGGTIMYRLFVPEDYDETKKYPLVLFLHGAGEFDSDNEAQLTGAYNVTKRLIKDDYLEKYPCIILAPQCSGIGGWSMGAPLVMSLINSLSEKYSIDRERLYITGLSLGGFGTWSMIGEYPDVFAAAVPLCGSITPDDENVEIYTKIPMWVFHGDKDPTVGVGSSRNAVAAVKRAGGKYIRYTEIAGADHNIWNTVYKTEELYEWMFAQRLGNPVSVRTLDVFRDVSVTSWYYEAIKYAYYENIFKGVSEKEFKPNMKMSRAMFVTALHRVEGEPESKNQVKFADVAEGKWYTEAIKWASEKGLVLGKSAAEFAPDENITREQLMTLMYRYADFCSLDTSARAEEKEVSDWTMVSDYAADAVLWTVSEKLVEGKGVGRIAPKEYATRAEVATIVKRFMEYKNK